VPVSKNTEAAGCRDRSNIDAWFWSRYVRAFFIECRCQRQKRDRFIDFSTVAVQSSELRFVMFELSLVSRLWFETTPTAPAHFFGNIPGPCSPGYYLRALAAPVESRCGFERRGIEARRAAVISAWGVAKRSPRNAQKKRSSAESASELPPRTVSQSQT
jgi:hypothetical protein